MIINTRVGVPILATNRTFCTNPGLLVFPLFLGAVMAVEFRLLLEALVKDINTLFATIRSIGIVPYTLAIIYMFPAIPQWTAKLSPTYYMIQPVIEVTQNGITWCEIALQVYILVGLIVLFGVVLDVIANHMREKESLSHPNLIPKN